MCAVVRPLRRALNHKPENHPNSELKKHSRSEKALSRSNSRNWLNTKIFCPTQWPSALKCLDSPLQPREAPPPQFQKVQPGPLLQEQFQKARGRSLIYLGLPGLLGDLFLAASSRQGGTKGSPKQPELLSMGPPHLPLRDAGARGRKGRFWGDVRTVIAKNVSICQAQGPPLGFRCGP